MTQENSGTEPQMLSIVIPVYNSKKYLPGCIDSILAVEAARTEIILVDDGSTDGSTELCRQYQQSCSSVKMLRQENQGPSSARNRGLEQAAGRYIAFLDSDDRISPDALRKTLSYLEKYPDADLWISDFYRVADNGYILDRICQIDDTSEPIQGREYLLQFLRKKGCVWNVWRYLFQRDFLLRNGLRFIEGVSCAEDLEYVVRALTKAEKPVFFHNPYYFYRVNYGNTLTRRYTQSRVQELSDMLQRSVGYLRKDPTESARLLSDKIILEYTLNIALLEEVPAAERPAAHGALQSADWILESSEKKSIRLIKIFLSLAGIDAFSKVLYYLKRVKRKVREGRTAFCHGNGGS